MNKQEILNTYFTAEPDLDGVLEHRPNEGIQVEYQGEPINSIELESGNMVMYTNQQRESYWPWTKAKGNEFTIFELTQLV